MRLIEIRIVTSCDAIGCGTEFASTALHRTDARAEARRDEGARVAYQHVIDSGDPVWAPDGNG